MKDRKKNIVFLCQITDTTLKVAKCLSSNNSQRQFVGLEVESISPDINEKKLTEKLVQVFKGLGYSQNPVVISLSHSKATSRYLKIPASKPEEIEKIVSLQASKYLPYPAEELITGYQILSKDREGYSQIHLIIVHKDVIEGYLRIFKTLKAAKITIALSSYGLVNFFNYVKPQEPDSVIIIDIDYQQAELVIVSQKELLFSRYFKINKTLSNWEDLFINEINKTRDAYLKEVSGEIPRKIMLVGAEKNCQEFAQALNKQMDLMPEVLSYDKINFSNNLLNRISGYESSFASIIGLGLKDVEECLNLLPQDIKQKNKILLKRKEYLRLSVLISCVILITGIGILKNLDNKTQYLTRLKAELDKISGDARILEEIEKRLQFMQQRSEKKLSGLNILYELHQTIPSDISLVNLSYEENNQVILRGQTLELNSVFAFAEQLKKSEAFKKFNIKIRYATQKKTQTGGVVDFEIVCSKK